MDLESFDEARPDLESLEGSHRLGRRSFLIGALATGAAVAAPVNYAALARKRRIPAAKHGKFDLGVASGFPRPRGIELWTRVGEIKRTSKLKVVVATDRKFGNVVDEKVVTARSERDFTARTFIKGLKPDRHYFYRFVTDDSKSPVGRFKTAPPLNSRKPIRIAFYSCQHYEAGLYNAQRAIANERDLDLVLCLGDYIYEYSDGNGVRRDTSGDNHDGDAQLLREYWQKYRVYKSDKDLQAMHAAHPFLSVWDDHEVEDNYADGQASSHQQDPSKTQLRNYPRRVPFAQREANGYRSFFNYMPRSRFKGDRRRVYEEYRLGRLVDLLLTDERQYRDRQPCNDAQLAPCPDAESPRTMLGTKQLDWFLDNLQASPSTWKLWGTELMVMGTRVAPGVLAQVDAWDGYAYERKRILDFILDNNVQNVVAITGDIHTFFAGTAYTTGDQATGRAALPEFVGGSATSHGLPEATGFDPATLAAIAKAADPHLQFADFVNHGYGVIELGPTEALCELKAVDVLHQGAATPRTLAKFRVPLGSRSPEQIG